MLCFRIDLVLMLMSLVWTRLKPIIHEMRKSLRELSHTKTFSGGRSPSYSTPMTGTSAFRRIRTYHAEYSSRLIWFGTFTKGDFHPNSLRSHLLLKVGISSNRADSFPMWSSVSCQCWPILKSPPITRFQVSGMIELSKRRRDSS